MGFVKMGIPFGRLKIALDKGLCYDVGVKNSPQFYLGKEKCNMNMKLKRLLAMALCLALAVTLLPTFATVAQAAPTAPAPEGIVFHEEEDWTDTLKNTNGWGAPAGSTKQMSITADGLYKITGTGLQAGNTYVDFTLSDLNIASTGSTVICLEYSVSAPSNQYWIKPMETTGATLTVDESRTDATVNKAHGIGNTDTAGFETHRQYWTVGAGTLTALTLRIGGRKGTGADAVQYDFFKLYQVSYTEDQLKAELESADGYAVLSADADFGATALTLGEKATLDLNGHTLTATAVNGGSNAVIIDSDAEKAGRLDAALALDNASNPQLPLSTDAGYLFSEPKLNEAGIQRAFLVEGSTSADGFIMDFRPGFGESIRTNYLQAGASGIQMTTVLTWTDIYGNEGSKELNAAGMFDGMYATATKRGRLTLTGAEQYQQISLAITLKSCGVVVAFDPVVFNNEYVTAHFAADFESGELVPNVGASMTCRGDTAIETKDDNKVLKIYSTNDLYFANNIVAGEGKKLVIQFNLMTPDGKDSLAVRARPVGGGDYVHLLYSKGTSGNAPIYEDKGACYLSSANAFVKVRMEMDLETGAYTISCPNKAIAGTYQDVASFFADRNMLYIYIDGTTNTHYIDNLVLYTITAPATGE